MRKADLFDEIIFRLRESAAHEPTTQIDPDLFQALMSAAPPREEEKIVTPAPAAAPVAPAAETIPLYAPEPPVRKPLAGSLQALAQSVQNCQNCGLCSTRKNVVFGDGNPNAELMFIGEGPGESEDEQGLPFVGRAGDLLTRMIGAMGRPPGNRNPEEAEARACLPYLDQQIELVKPKVLVLLGAVPLLYLLNMRGIMRLHGNWFEYKGIKTLPTFHPAYLLRNPPMKAEAWKDLQVVMREFGKMPQKRNG